MKPKIGSGVWIIGDNEICMEFVGWFGIQSFVISHYENRIKSEFYYDDYGKTWVNTLEEAKAILQKKFGSDAKIVKLGYRWFGKELE